MFIRSGSVRSLAPVMSASVLLLTAGCGLLDRGETAGDGQPATWTSSVPNTGTAEPAGVGGPIDVGMHYDEVIASHPDFPAQSEGVPYDGGRYQFVWEDGEYLFDHEGFVVSTGHFGGERRGTKSASGAAGDSSSGTAGGASVPAWVSDLPGVEVGVLRPVGADGSVQSGWQVEQGGGSCESSAGSRPSPSAVEAGTVQCSTVTAMAARDCWPDETRRAALCLRDASEPVLVRIASPGTLAGQAANPGAQPVAAALEDGSSCSFVSGGAQSSFTEAGITFTTRGGCSGSGRMALLTSGQRDATSGIYSSGGQTVIDVTSDFETTRQMRITSLSFLGTA